MIRPTLSPVTDTTGAGTTAAASASTQHAAHPTKPSTNITQSGATPAHVNFVFGEPFARAASLASLRELHSVSRRVPPDMAAFRDPSRSGKNRSSSAAAPGGAAAGLRRAVAGCGGAAAGLWRAAVGLQRAAAGLRRGCGGAVAARPQSGSRPRRRLAL